MVARGKKKIRGTWGKEFRRKKTRGKAWTAGEKRKWRLTGEKNGCNALEGDQWEDCTGGVASRGLKREGNSQLGEKNRGTARKKRRKNGKGGGILGGFPKKRKTKGKKLARGTTKGGSPEKKKFCGDGLSKKDITWRGKRGLRVDRGREKERRGGELGVCGQTAEKRKCRVGGPEPGETTRSP